MNPTSLDDSQWEECLQIHHVFVLQTGCQLHPQSCDLIWKPIPDDDDDDGGKPRQDRLVVAAQTEGILNVAHTVTDQSAAELGVKSYAKILDSGWDGNNSCGNQTAAERRRRKETELEIKRNKTITTSGSESRPFSV